MPCCPTCHVAAVAVAHSAAAVRDLGFTGAVSTAAASALGIDFKRGLLDFGRPLRRGRRRRESDTPAGVRPA